MQTEVTATFSDRLEDLIRESGKDMRTLAQNIGISTGALSNYRNDYAEVGITTFKKIADYFEVSYDYLLGNSDNRQRENIDIGRQTGLSDKTIEILKSHHRNAEIINLLLENHIFSNILIARINNFLMYHSVFEREKKKQLVDKSTGAFIYSQYDSALYGILRVFEKIIEDLYNENSKIFLQRHTMDISQGEEGIISGDDSEAR